MGALLEQECIPGASNSDTSVTFENAHNKQACIPTAVHFVNTLAGSDNQHTDTTGANSLPPSCVARSTPHTSGCRDPLCDVISKQMTTKVL